ncbi:MAG: CAP domain-containing protein [Actinomycetota bacterium]
MRVPYVFSIVLIIATLGLSSGPADAGSDPGVDEARFVALINDVRWRNGLPPLAVDAELTWRAREWSQVMAAHNSLHHAPDLSAGITADWQVLGENVGVHGAANVDELFHAFVASPAHYANILDPRFAEVGIGVVYDANGTMWTTHRFMARFPPPAPAPIPAPIPVAATPVPLSGLWAAPAPAPVPAPAPAPVHP